MESFTIAIEASMKTQKDFTQKIKQRLVHESNNVTNSYKFIAGLFTEGVLSDKSSDPAEVVGLKEIMVQLAITIASSKGADAIGGLMKALEGSGNSQIVAALRTWVKEDFGIEPEGELSKPTAATSAVSSPSIKKLQKCLKSRTESSSSGTTLIDKITSRLEDHFIEQLECHLVGKASEILNTTEFCTSLAHQNVLEETDIQLANGPEVEEVQLTEKAIRAACSKKAIGSLVLALQRSNNERILMEIYNWLETSQARKKNYPIAVKTLASQKRQEESKAVKSAFFDQATLPYAVSKLATFNCLQNSAAKGVLHVQFDKERMIACCADGTLNLWNMRGTQEGPTRIAANVKNITCFQYDEEILVLGTGTAEEKVHVFDSKTFEEKYSTRFFDPVISLKFIESTLVVIKGVPNHKRVWWNDICRTSMQILNPGSFTEWADCKNQTPGVCMYPDTSFLYLFRWVYAYNTKSGQHILDDSEQPCYLSAPATISALHVGDLFGTKRVVAAGCHNGMIAIWNTSKLMHKQSPITTFQGHTGAIVSLCSLNGHLLSLDGIGKLFMWSVRDLESQNVTPVPRMLVENSNSTYLVAHDRWFALYSSEDDVINIWTVPDSWLTY